MEEDLNYDEPSQNMDEGWGDEDAGQEGGGGNWSDEMSQDEKEGDWEENDGGWDDEGDNEAGWDNEEDQMAMDPAEEKQEVINGYVVIRDPKTELGKEMRRAIKDISNVLFVEEGQTEIALRNYKWAKQTLETAWFKNDDSPGKMREKLGISRKPDEWEDQASTTRIPCCTYIPEAKADTSSSSSSSSKTGGAAEVTEFVVKALKDGMSTRDIIREARSLKFAVGDVMQAIQKQTSKSATSSSSSSDSSNSKSSICAKSKGTFALTEGMRLNCGHGRCDDCWKSFCKAMVKSGKDALTCKCNHLICNKNHQHKYILGCFCTEKIPREVFEKYLPKKEEGEGEEGGLLEKYNAMTLESYLNNAIKFGLRKCPNKSCGLWYKKKSPKSEIVSCECSQKMCFNCGLPPHQPIPCSNALDWQKRCSADVQTEIWRVMNTATCPNKNCGIIIKREIDDKDRCLHMICSECKYHWCWACREEFRPGGANKNHDSFYHCKLYEEGKLRSDVKEMNRKVETVRKEAATFKWAEHLRSCCDKDTKDLQTLQRSLEAEMLKNGGEVGKYKFLFDAISKLILANDDKKRLYIVAFYAAMDHKKHLFEFQLKDMAEKTTKLLNMLQPNTRERRSLEEFEKDMKDLNQQTKLVSAFLQKLRKDVQEGECVTILDKPDDKSAGWFCMSCNRMNSYDKFVCECMACQVHGEKRCLRCNPEHHVHYLDDV